MNVNDFITTFTEQPDKLWAESNLNLPDGSLTIIKQNGDFQVHRAGSGLYDALTAKSSSKPEKIVSFVGKVKHEDGKTYPDVSFITNFEPFLTGIDQMRKNGRMLENLQFTKKGRNLTFIGIKTVKRKVNKPVKTTV